MRNTICPKCEENIVKNYYAKQCSECYQSSKDGEGNPNWRGSSICKECEGKRGRGNKTGLCGDCYKGRFIKGLPKCICCGEDLSRHDSLKKGTGYCQSCYKGENTTRWNHELTKEERLCGRSINPDYTTWRTNVYERDCYCCQSCGDDSGGNLIAHHIKSYKDHKDLRTELDNGITLCEPCHRDYHKEHGYY